MNTKPWYASRGVMGSLFGAIASVVVFYNAVISPSTGVPIPDDVVQQVNSPDTIIAFASVGGFFASIVSWIGRLKAKTTITL